MSAKRLYLMVPLFFIVCCKVDDNRLTSSAAIAPNSTCPYGGKVALGGADENDDEILQPDEVDARTVVCNRTPAACGTIAHGDTETRKCFSVGLVPFGSTCEATNQNRTCDNGSWVTDWPACENLSCEVAEESRSPCGDIAHANSDSRRCFAAASVPSGETCAATVQRRTCDDGVWSPDWPNCTYLSCIVEPPILAPCGNTPHGETQVRQCYTTGTVSAGSVCQFIEQFRTCDDGSWSPRWPACDHVFCAPLLTTPSGFSVHPFRFGYDNSTQPQNVALYGNTLYMDSFRNLVVLDISVPREPSYVVDFITTWFIQDIDVDAATNRLYVASGNPGGIEMYDISDPRTPSKLGAYEAAVEVKAVSAAGDTLVLAEGTYGVQTLSIANPAKPVLLGRYNTPGDARELVVSGNHAFVADFDQGLQIINIIDPNKPVLSGSYNTPGFAMDVAVQGDYAYLANSSRGLQVLNISDHAAPNLVAELITSGPAEGVDVVGNFAYVATRAGGMQVFDVSTPSAPVLVGEYDTEGSAYSVSIGGSFAFIADSFSGLEVIDIAPAVLQQSTGRVVTDTSTRRLAENNGYVFSPSYGHGLVTYDVGNPQTPLELTDPYLPSDYLPFQTFSDMVFRGSDALVGYSGAGLKLVALDNPETAQFIGDAYTQPGWFDVQGDHAYVVGPKPGFVVLDLKNPLSIQQTGSYSVQDTQDVIVLGNYGYVATSGSSAIKVLDIQDSTFPSFVMDYSASHLTRLNITVAGDVAYIGGKLFDLTRPPMISRPNYVYAVEEKSGVYEINLTDDTTPLFAASYDIPGRAYSLVVQGKYAYVSTDESFESIELLSLTMTPNLTNAAPSSTQNYTISWPTGAYSPKVYCAVDGGICNVINTDQDARTAIVNWKVPTSSGRYQLDVAVGNWHYFISAREVLQVP